MAVAKNVIANWSNLLLSILSVLVLYPFLTRMLGEEQYGIWLYISSITGYFALLQLGVPLANVRFVSKHFANHEYDKINEVLSSITFFYLAVAVLSVISGVVFSFLLPSAFRMSETYVGSAKIAMVLAAFNVAASFIFSAFEGILHALQEFVYLNHIKNLFIIIRLALTFYCVKQNNGIVILAAILLVLTVLQGVAVLWVSKHKLKTLKINFALIDKNLLKELSRYSVFVMILQLAGILSFQTDAIVIGSFLSVSYIIYFSIANNILMYLMQFVIGISQAIMPRISAMDAVGDKEAIAREYFKFSRLTFIIVAPICLFLVISGGDFIALWMGEKFRDASSQVLTILVISYLFLMVQRGVAFPICMGTSKMKFLSLLMIATAIANLFLSIWWGVKYGIQGVAWGTTAPNLFTVCGILWFMKKTFSINILHYVWNTMIVPGGGVVLFGLSAFALKTYFTPSYATLSVVLTISLLLYLGAIRLICFREGFKKAVAS